MPQWLRHHWWSGSRWRIPGSVSSCLHLWKVARGAGKHKNSLQLDQIQIITSLTPHIALWSLVDPETLFYVRRCKRSCKICESSSSVWTKKSACPSMFSVNTLFIPTATSPRLPDKPRGEAKASVCLSPFRFPSQIQSLIDSGVEEYLVCLLRTPYKERNPLRPRFRVTLIFQFQVQQNRSFAEGEKRIPWFAL